eukprot:351226-Chlamydomonas_euryale.AAC.8
MAWHGMAWHGMARHGMAWHGMAWYSMAQHGMVQHDTAWHGMAWQGTSWHSMARHGMAWYSMAQHGTAWHGMAWYSMAQHGTAWHGMARHGMECKFVARCTAPCRPHPAPSSAAIFKHGIWHLSPGLLLCPAAAPSHLPQARMAQLGTVWHGVQVSGTHAPLTAVLAQLPPPQRFLLQGQGCVGGHIDCGRRKQPTGRPDGLCRRLSRPGHPVPAIRLFKRAPGGWGTGAADRPPGSMFHASCTAALFPAPVLSRPPPRCALYLRVRV